MFGREQLIQAGVFIGTAVVGVLLLVVLPRGCRETGNNESAPVPTAVAPAPGLIHPPSATGAASAGLATADSTSGNKLATDSAAFAAAAIELSQSKDEDANEKLAELLGEWAEVDAKGAAAWVLTLPAGEFRESAATYVVESWTEVDPRAAAAWVSAHLMGGKSQGALGALIAVWAGKNPSAAAEWVLELKGEDRTAAMGALAESWAGREPSAAVAWWQTLPAEDQGAAWKNLLGGWCGVDAAAAAAWLARSVGQNPNLPASSASLVVAAWGAQDVGAVSKWLNGLPEGPFYQAAATAFSQIAAETSPGDALLWARSLANVEDRKNAVVHAFDRWYDNKREELLSALPAQLEALKDSVLRRAVYDLLYQKDQGFRDALLDLAEAPAPATDGSAPPPAAEKSGASPVKED